MYQLVPIRVLLVGDHDYVLWGLKKLIDGEWPRMMVTATANSGSEALAVIRDRVPDVIVFDVVTGKDSGLDCLRGLREADGPQVLLLAGLQDTELRRRSGAAGAWRVIIKDSPAEVLLREIEAAHERRTVRHAAR
jgi:DNA-binding NarL/FixJ family response regulator